jgi:streptogrisin C
VNIRRSIRTAAIVLAVTALSLSYVAPAGAERPRSDAGIHPSVLAAVQRDLDLSAADAERLIRRQAGVSQLSADLAAKLGDDYAGSWFDHKAGKLVVAVSRSERAALARAGGAHTKVVTRSLRALNAITAELDTLAARDRSRGAKPAPGDAPQKSKLIGAVSWSVDVQRNQVLVKVRQGQRAIVAGLLAKHGDAVRIEETDVAPRTTADYLDGGDRYNSCSVGFNVALNGVGYFLTAGHCGTPGVIAVQNSVRIGPFVESYFPTFDDALVEVDNPDFWIQGPWVFPYDGNPDSFLEIHGYLDSPVDTVLCKSGYKTGLTCGWIRAKDVTVNYVQGPVFGLTQHSACVEGGDSGGANYSPIGSQNFAEGMTSGGTFFIGDSRCLNKVDPMRENESFYQPIAPSIEFYGVDLMTV